MKRTNLIFTLLALASTSPALAKDYENSFTHEGVTYSYTLRTEGKVTYIDGEAKPGSTFHLQVRDGRVHGTVGGSDVAFAVPQQKSVVGDVRVTGTR